MLMIKTALIASALSLTVVVAASAQGQEGTVQGQLPAFGCSIFCDARPSWPNPSERRLQKSACSIFWDGCPSWPNPSQWQLQARCKVMKER